MRLTCACCAAKNQVNKEKSREKRIRKDENRFIQEQLRWVRSAIIHILRLPSQGACLQAAHASWHTAISPCVMATPAEMTPSLQATHST